MGQLHPRLPRSPCHTFPTSHRPLHHGPRPPYPPQSPRNPILHDRNCRCKLLSWAGCDWTRGRLHRRECKQGGDTKVHASRVRRYGQNCGELHRVAGAVHAGWPPCRPIPLHHCPIPAASAGRCRHRRHHRQLNARCTHPAPAPAYRQDRGTLAHANRPAPGIVDQSQLEERPGGQHERGRERARHDHHERSTQ